MSKIANSKRYNLGREFPENTVGIKGGDITSIA